MHGTVDTKAPGRSGIRVSSIARICKDNRNQTTWIEYDWSTKWNYEWEWSGGDEVDSNDNLIEGGNMK